MEYLLILTLIIAGERTEYVIDYGMTAQDCAQVVRENPSVPLFCEADGYQERSAPQTGDTIPTAADPIRV